MAKIDIFAPQDNSFVDGIAGKKIAFVGKNDCGKALVNSSVIPTPDGHRCVGDIKIGDYLFDDRGLPTKVVGVFPQGSKQIWNVEFVDGRIVKCCSEHLWEVFNTKNNRVVKNTSELSSVKNYRVPLCAPVNYEEKEYDIPPSVMGALLGNGC